MSRIVCQFSCGAASAVATKLALAELGPDVVIVNAFIQEEHSDNRRFLSDCERWFDRGITVLQSEKYNASTHEGQPRFPHSTPEATAKANKSKQGTKEHSNERAT